MHRSLGRRCRVSSLECTSPLPLGGGIYKHLMVWSSSRAQQNNKDASLVLINGDGSQKNERLAGDEIVVPEPLQ